MESAPIIEETHLNSSIFDRSLLDLGREADAVRRRMWGRNSFYVKNIHLNFTNICENKCGFCAFRREKGSADAYFYTIGELIAQVKEREKGTKELHIVGGLHPEADLNYYVDMISGLRAEFPQMGIKAFGAVEMEFMARKAGVSLEKLFTMLKDAGLDMMPGGGAEIFDPSLRNLICPEKISGERWLKVMQSAHEAGIKTNATMLYGHLETPRQREDHLLKIRELQERTGGFNAFIPLAFHPGNTKFSDVKPATAVDDLKVTAASRIILDNVPHIKAYWVMLGEKTAQMALHFGADDMDGTIVRENITYAAGAQSKRGMTEKELRTLIETADLLPVERDSFYNIVSEQEDTDA
jgi:aminodeoxyfutalosine synthase